MSRVAYVNGRYVPQRHAMVNIEDRGYQFADGVYEVVYVNGGRFIDEGRHLARLERSMRELRIVPPMGMAALRRVLREVALRNRIGDGLVYMQITRGVSPRNHPFPARPVPPAIVVTAKRLPPYPKDPHAWAGAAITAPDQRWERCDIKSTALLPNVLAKQAAREAGAIEAILIGRDGVATEGASTSVWAVDRDGVLRTHGLDHHILPGCTRGALLDELREAGIAVEERALSRDELRAAREIFLTSATSYVRPITSLDGAAVGDGSVGPVTRHLFALFARHVLGDLRNAA
jgi:D-alanine transaminase